MSADVYVVTGPHGWTESLSREVVETLVLLGLIEHERDGHVVATSDSEGAGPLHHFYRGSTT